MRYAPVLGAALAACVVATLAACQGGRKDAPQSAGTPATAASSKAASKLAVNRDNPCSILLPGEVEQILGTPITMREIMDEETCHFDYDKPEPGLPSYLEIKVHFTGGRADVVATRAAGKLLGNDSGFEKLDGIGDEAWLGPMASLLVFRKGEAGVQIDLRLVKDGREKGIRLAKLAADRLAAAGF